MKTLADVWAASLKNNGIQERVLLEVASVRDRVRPLGLYHCTLDTLVLFRELCGACRLHTLAVRHLWAVSDPFSSERLLFDNPPTDEAIEVIEVWFSLSELNDFSPSKNVGTLLGYPKCCVTKYEGAVTMSQFFLRYLTDNKSGHWLVNRLAGLFSSKTLMLDYLPCALSCGKSLRLASVTRLTATSALGEEYVKGAVEAQCAPLVVVEGDLLWNPSWRHHDGTLVLELDQSRSLCLSEVFGFGSDQVRSGLIPFTHICGVTQIELVRGCQHHRMVLKEGRWI